MSLDFFKIDNEIEPEKGLALISEPLSDDDYFGHSVVLLTEHSSKGSVGFVLNKETEYLLSDLIKDINSDFKVYKGGPVEPNTLHYIHSFSTINNAVEISNGLYWGGDFEQIKEWLNLGLINENQIQFFRGYSGWSENQLKTELNNKYWVVVEIEKEEVFLNRNSSFWRDKLKSMGEKYKIWLNVPENPSLN